MEIFFFTFCEREKDIWIFRLYYSAKKSYSNTYHISLLLLPSSLSKNMIRVPMLVPGLEYTFEIQVECISDLGISDQLHVFVTRDQVCTNAYCYTQWARKFKKVQAQKTS